MILCTPCVEHPLESPELNLNYREIIRKACEYLKLNESDVISKKRNRELVIARMIIIDLLLNQKCFVYTLSFIGKVLNKRDHTTIIHNRNTLKDWVETDEAMQTLLKNAHLNVFNSLRYFKF
jgi:chromosomal replication initiation ATPase DnaA